MWNRIKWQFILALFWFISAFLAIGAVLPWIWAWRCAWINVIIGLVGLLLMTSTEKGDRLFYHGPRENESTLWQLGMLWALTFAGLTIAVGWWLLRVFGFFDW